MKYWQEQKDSDKCYFHCQSHASQDCNSIKNALQKTRDNGVTQGPPQQPEPPTTTDTDNATPAARRVTLELSDNPFNIHQMENIED
eukprot:13455575-Ditylum_brightwellii.AAC.1